MKDWQYLALVIVVCSVYLGSYLSHLNKIGMAMIGKMDALMEKINDLERKWDDAELWKSN
jgi:hypothetical protein